MPYNGTIFMKETSSFSSFYTNSSFNPSCEGWVDMEIPSPWADNVPAVTQVAPVSSRLLQSYRAIAVSILYKPAAIVGVLGSRTLAPGALVY